MYLEIGLHKIYRDLASACYYFYISPV